MSKKILIVDDDRTLLRFLAEYLQHDGFQVATAEDGKKAIRMCYQEQPDLVILDVMMPGMDGWEVCARLHEMSDVPVILLTAKTEEADKLRGFRLGVDDYVTKPFSMAEMSARVRAVLARTATVRDEAEAVYQVGDLRVDLRRREATLQGQLLSLTPTEFRLLATLATRAGEAISQEDLIAGVWGDYRVDSGSALRRYIWLLRQKIEAQPDDPRRLITIRGYGYRLENNHALEGHS